MSCKLKLVVGFCALTALHTKAEVLTKSYRVTNNSVSVTITYDQSTTDENVHNRGYPLTVLLNKIRQNPDVLDIELLEAESKLSEISADTEQGSEYTRNYGAVIKMSRPKSHRVKVQIMESYRGCEGASLSTGAEVCRSSAFAMVSLQ